MIDSLRFRERLAAAGLSQSELARRVNVTQGTIAKLASGAAQGSSHLHRIARQLGTTPAYLSGEIDDPAMDAPPPPSLPLFQHILMPVALPSEDALAQMFEGLLMRVDRDLPVDALAQALAALLPAALSQPRGRPADTAHATPAPVAATRANSTPYRTEAPRLHEPRQGYQPPPPVKE